MCFYLLRLQFCFLFSENLHQTAFYFRTAILVFEMVLRFKIANKNEAEDLRFARSGVEKSRLARERSSFSIIWPDLLFVCMCARTVLIISEMSQFSYRHPTTNNRFNITCRCNESSASSQIRSR